MHTTQFERHVFSCGVRAVLSKNPKNSTDIYITELVELVGSEDLLDYLKLHKEHDVINYVARRYYE